MTEFKVGDKVICVRGYSGFPKLIKGEEYTILEGPNTWGCYRTGKEFNEWWDATRFISMNDSELLVKENKMFNVDEFRTGMRVVYRNGEVGIVLKDIKVIGLQGAFNSLPEQYEFEKDEDGWTIDEVYSGFKNHSSVLVFEKKGALLWKREVETEAQKRVKELEQTILNAQKQLAELKKEI